MPLKGKIDYGFPFYVEGRLEEPARRDVYYVKVLTPSGLKRHVALYPVPGEPRLVRSELTYVMWDVDRQAVNAEVADVSP